MRTVIITGATRGLGYSLAGAFAHAGYRVGVLGRDLQTAKAACHRLKGEVWPIEADVRDAASLEDAAQDCRQRFGRLDVWIQNAGIVKDRSLIKMTDTEWQEVIDTNLTGAFYGIRAAARAMMRQKNGAILAIGSFVSLQGGYGNANYAA